MANFAIAAEDAVIARGNKLIESLQEPGEKKGATLSRLFDIVAVQLDGQQLRSNGVDTEALDASLSNIRNLFVAALSGREEIRADYEGRIQTLREEKEALEKNCKKQLGELLTQKEDALGKYNLIKKEQDAQEAAKKALAEQLAASQDLAKEKEKTGIMLMEKLREAERKAGNADKLEKENEQLKEQIAALQLAAKDAQRELSLSDTEKKSLEGEKKELLGRMQAFQKEQEKHQEKEEELLSKISALSQENAALQRDLLGKEKDAALKRERAVMEKEREMLEKMSSLRDNMDKLKEEKYDLQVRLVRAEKNKGLLA